MSTLNTTSIKTTIGYFVSAFLLTTGLVALASPTTLAAGFGQPTPPHTTAAAFVQCFGARNFTVGIAVAALTRKRNWQAVGLITALLAIDGFSDAWVCWREAGFLWAVPHLIPSVVIPFIGRWVMMD